MKAQVKKFDQKFGPKFLATLPTTPGVYRIFNLASELIYVGKAKNLRRRLSQYRNAKRRKRHLKMRQVVQEAVRIEIELHPSDREASLAEARLIQNLRPKWNVAGAFYFLYPVIGLAYEEGVLRLLYTTEPDALEASLASQFSFHGAFRSRFLCGGGFFALAELFAFIGHKNKTHKIGKYTYIYSFRQIAKEWPVDLDLLFRGESKVAFERLVMELVEHSSARRKSKEIQKLLNDVKRFWRHEAQLLYRVRTKVGHLPYPIAQKYRDILFLEHRFHSHPSKSEALTLNERDHL